MKWVYKYKPMSQRGAHEVTRSKFEKVTKLSGDEHKTQIEHALQNGIRVSLHVLKDYPDLVQKYNKTAKVRNFDRISAKAKESKQKVESAKQGDENAKDTAIPEKKEKYVSVKQKLQQRAYESENLDDFKSKIMELAKEGYEVSVRDALGVKKIYKDNSEPRKIKDFYDKHKNPNKSEKKERETDYKITVDDIVNNTMEIWNNSSDIRKNELFVQLEQMMGDGSLSEDKKRAAEIVYNKIKTETAKPLSDPALDKARKEKDPKTKWRNLKAILDKAKAENNVPEGLEQEVKEAGKAMLNHALSGEWESKSPKKEINIDSMNPKRTK